MVKLHDIRNGKLLTEFKGHTSFVNDVLFSTDNTKVISGSSDGSIKVSDLQGINVNMILISSLMIDLG